jgi:hypothetical protein
MRMSDDRIASIASRADAAPVGSPVLLRRKTGAFEARVSRRLKKEI